MTAKDEVEDACKTLIKALHVVEEAQGCRSSGGEMEIGMMAANFLGQTEKFLISIRRVATFDIPGETEDECHRN